MRKTNFVVGEYYHVYNRGTDKRSIFIDQDDLNRFWESINDFNQVEPIGSMFEYSFIKKNKSEDKNKKPLIEFVSFCLNPNHFHFLITPMVESGVEKFMQRLGNGYTKYFNNRHKRSGVLFQGKFKSKHIDSNEYLMHLSAYINANNQLGHPMSKLSRSSLPEYENLNVKGICNKSIILEQFGSIKEYLEFVDDSVRDIKLRKELEKELGDL